MKMTLEQIKDYWTNQAVKNGTSYSASWTDKHMMDLEYEALVGEIYSGKVLDVGCANGYTTLRIAKKIGCNITAIDYVPEMIEQAQAALEQQKEFISGVTFSVGNVMSLDFPDNAFDVVMVVRVLINLENPENQKKAIRECIRVLRPGGKLIISEATLQGWENLNKLRSELGLDIIPMPEFNAYLDEKDIMYACSGAELHDTINFSSSYFLGTRVLKPLLARLGARIDVSDPLSEINKLFKPMPMFGNYGTQKMFVFIKEDK